MRTAFLLFACLSSTATAATLRPFGQVAGPVVCVADLWDDAGEAAPRALGPAPAPGERIVVDAPQLAAIARQFGVDWRPDSATERSILERPGMPLPHDAVEAALAAALAASGAPDGSIELPDFSPPLVAPDAHPRIVVEQLQWEPAGARFAASLAVTGRNMTTLRLRVSGRVVDMVDAVVSTRRLLAGDVLRAADVTLARLPRERLRGEAVGDVAQVAGQSVRRGIGAGEPVLAAELAPPSAVAKGATVAMAISVAGIEASASGQALDAGALGDRIRVLNVASRAIVLAEIIGSGSVRVTPGSQPLRRAAGIPAGIPAGLLP